MSQNRGLPSFSIVGLPSKGVEEAKDRVRTAIINASLSMPDSRITVNLAPADIPKNGSGFDLPIAVGILISSGSIKADSIRNALFIGELSLEGTIRGIPGILSIALMAKNSGIHTLFVPEDNAIEASCIDGLTIYPVHSLSELVLHLNGLSQLNPQKPLQIHELASTISTEVDFADIKGQFGAKRAMEIAAAGFHNIHLRGSPGGGKTMLCRAFPSIMPRMDADEILEVSRLYSVSGQLDGKHIKADRPFRSPHHTTSRVGLIGGGSSPMPGEISLAHRGVLFLDELPEFPRSVLESLRQPLEDGIVTVSRAAGTLTFPSRFLLIAASNPCPCGYADHPKKRCTCLAGAITKYKKRLSGPLLDRIDMHLTVPPVEVTQLSEIAPSESSVSIRIRVENAQERQRRRFQKSKIKTNGEMSSSDIKKYCQISVEGENLLKQAVERLSLSARSYFKVLKVAVTIADLAGKDSVSPEAIAEGLQYRVSSE
jgi:magnesium chelatase family protein